MTERPAGPAGPHRRWDEAPQLAPGLVSYQALMEILRAERVEMTTASAAGLLEVGKAVERLEGWTQSHDRVHLQVVEEQTADLKRAITAAADRRVSRAGVRIAVAGVAVSLLVLILGVVSLLFAHVK